MEEKLVLQTCKEVLEDQKRRLLRNNNILCTAQEATCYSSLKAMNALEDIK